MELYLGRLVCFVLSHSGDSDECCVCDGYRAEEKNEGYLSLLWL